MSGSSPKSISISGVETDITIGKELAAVAQKSKALASRDCFEQLEMYLHGRSHDRVCLLFGLTEHGVFSSLEQAKEQTHAVMTSAVEVHLQLLKAVA